MMDLGISLRLKHVERSLPDLLEQAPRESLTYETFLHRVLTWEFEARQLQTQQARWNAPHLPTRKILEEFEFAFLPSISERLIRKLADLSFLKTKTHVVFLGPPGVGKTHLRLGLAVKALEAGYSVVFTTFSHLAQELATAPHPSLLPQRLRRYLRPHVLIIQAIKPIIRNNRRTCFSLTRSP